MSLFNKLNPDDSQGGAQAKLTAKQFLSKDPKVKGYTTPDAFLTYGKSLRPSEVEQLEQGFSFIKDKVKIIGSLTTRPDRSHRSYAHPTFLHGNAQQGCKIILEAGMKEFLQDYIKGNVAIGFTLEELIEEAMND